MFLATKISKIFVYFERSTHFLQTHTIFSMIIPQTLWFILGLDMKE